MKSRPPSPGRLDGLQDDVKILQQLLALHHGELEDFQPVRPPAAVRGFLGRASLHELQGVLVETLAAMRMA
jgi:hypothetical protein